MSESWLSYLNLSDDYERRARFLPAFLSALPLVPAAAAVGAPVFEWLKLAGVGVGAWAVVSVAVSHFASACGNRLQSRLWPEWPADAPTHQWLHPDYGGTSSQQKGVWYTALESLVGIDIQKAVDGNSEVRATIGDAVKAARGLLWRTEGLDRLRLHNVDYGFARNLVGLRPVWMAFAIGGTLVCWGAWQIADAPIVWALLDTVVLLGALVSHKALDGYVYTKADYYAEAFFDAVVQLASSRQSEE